MASNREAGLAAVGLLFLLGTFDCPQNAHEAADKRQFLSADGT